MVGRKCLGNKRQVFFCSYGGHDTHADQGGYDINATPSPVYVPGDLDDNMTVLDDALLAFNALMMANPERFGIADKDTAVRLSFVSVAIWWVVFSIPLMVFFREIPLAERVSGWVAVKAGVTTRYSASDIRVMVMSASMPPRLFRN